MQDENLIVKQVSVGPMMNYSYVIKDGVTGKGFLIDPSWEAEKLISLIEKGGVELAGILITHSHFDHVNALPSILEKFEDLKIYVHQDGSSELPEKGNYVYINDNDRIKLGSLEIKVFHTPGHAKGAVCYVVDESIFTGDTLFVDAIGRTDLEGGDPEVMFDSLQKLKQLPDNMIIYSGHNYGADEVSTIGEQKKRNPYLVCSSKDDFLRLV